MAKDKAELTKAEKMALVRDVMIRFPDYRRYGYNRKIIELIKKETSVLLEDYDISRYVKEIEAQWQADKNVSTTKSQMRDMMFGLFESKEAKVVDKRMVLQDIAKLDGHMNADITINNILPEQEKKLKSIFGERGKEKGKKEKEKPIGK